MVEIETYGVLTKVDDGATITLLVPGAIEDVAEVDWESATCGLPEGPDFWLIDGSGGFVVWRIDRSAARAAGA